MFVLLAATLNRVSVSPITVTLRLGSWDLVICNPIVCLSNISRGHDRKLSIHDKARGLRNLDDKATLMISRVMSPQMTSEFGMLKCEYELASGFYLGENSHIEKTMRRDYWNLFIDRGISTHSSSSSSSVKHHGKPH